MFAFFRKKPHKFFSAEEQEKILDAIRTGEKTTSGEIRVFIENRCRFVNAIDRAAELFYALSMEKTRHRNGTLVYIALKDRQLAVYGDQGIHEKTGNKFWEDAVHLMVRNFNNENYAEGIATVVLKIGETLSFHFPYEESTDKNELPDELVFGH